MRVESWVIALAIRLPADLVEALGLKEGDAVELRIVGLRTVASARAIAAKPRYRVSRSRAGSFRRIGNSTARTPTRVNPLKYKALSNGVLEHHVFNKVVHEFDHLTWFDRHARWVCGG